MLDLPAGLDRRAVCLADGICLFGLYLGASFKVIRALVSKREKGIIITQTNMIIFKMVNNEYLCY